MERVFNWTPWEVHSQSHSGGSNICSFFHKQIVRVKNELSKSLRKDMDNVELGTCSVYNCDWRIYLIVPCLGLACFLTFFEVVPGTTACQALVSDHLRTAGLGLQAIIFRCFGSIPIPLFRVTQSLLCWNRLWPKT